MKKSVIALVIAVCLIALPVSVLAEETDYSYLEEMSVKELKELRNAINEILGDTGMEGTEEEKTFPEKDANGYKLDISDHASPYFDATALAVSCKKDLAEEDSFKLKKVYYLGDSLRIIEYFLIYFTSTNASGKITRTYWIVNLKGGSVIEDLHFNEVPKYNHEEGIMDIAQRMNAGRLGYELDSEFIEYSMEEVEDLYS